MIVAIEQITWNQLHWLKLLYALYIFLLRQAGKAGVFYSADKCFETGADSRNIFDKQIVKVWTPGLSAFYCVILRATLAWSLKACAIARSSKSARARTKTIGSHPIGSHHARVPSRLTAVKVKSGFFKIKPIKKPYDTRLCIIMLRKLFLHKTWN